jgi:BirA family biotin operon repressor/biotin-[acetyl-CoA-carboxylase] ligase
MSPDAIAVDEALNIDLIRQHLDAHTVGRRLVLHEVVASTNATLRTLADAGTPDGTVVLAEQQTAGRGRGNKAWFSPAGVNLYASILFRPPIGVAAAPCFAFIASLALADAIRELGIPVALKWPNDVLVGGRKVAGVRAETTARGDAVDHVVLGVRWTGMRSQGGFSPASSNGSASTSRRANRPSSPSGVSSTC